PAAGCDRCWRSPRWRSRRSSGRAEPRARGHEALVTLSHDLGGLMVVPLIGRIVAAVAGGLLVLAVWGSVIGTLIVPRPVGSRLTRWVDRLVNGAFTLATAAIADYRRRDR